MATGDYTQPKYEGYPPGIAGTFSGDSAARIVEVPLEYAVDEVITDHLIFRGAGRLIPANGVTLELQGGYSAHDYQHVFDISSGGAVVGLQANYVTPWHFGATAEGNSGDDTAAINAAIQYATLAQVRDEYATGHRVVFPPVPLITRGYYYITSDIVVNRNVIIEGNAPAGSLLGAVRVVAADTCDAAFWFASPGGLSAVEPYTSEVGANFWGAGRSVMRHFLIEPENPGGVNFGIIHNVPVHFYDITCHEFDLANFFAHAHTSGNSDYGTPIGTTGAGTMHGNADQSLYEKCLANACQNGHGFAAKGNDAQIML